MKTSVINTRVRPELKADVEQILSQLGISTTQAITMYFEQIKMSRGIPFALKIPNDETVEAMKAGRTEKGEAVTIDQLRESLN